ncbi:MAG: lysophospholipid acyltransferase family protein [Pseudomonadota bacterium]
MDQYNLDQYNKAMLFTRGQVIVGIFSITAHLPLWACRGMGRVLGFLLWATPNRSRSTTVKNIALCFPELCPKAQQRLVFSSLQHTGMLTFEVAPIWQKPYKWLEKYLLHIENKQLFDQAQEKPQGLIILLPHLGNWEIFSRFIPAQCDAIGLYEPPAFPELEKLIKNSREKTGASMVPTNSRGVAALLKYLRKGGTTCILPDQVPTQKDRGGVFAPFFGHPAYTMTLVNQLQQRTACTVIGATAKRVSKGFVIRFWQVDNSVYQSDELTAATAVNAMVEASVRDAPEQYQWEYKRFRRVPPGGTRLY